MDEPLEPRGLAQASALAGKLSSFDAAFTSPARCAVETAAALRLAAAVEPALADLDFGQWKGHALADIEATDAAGLAHWLTDPDCVPHGGESISALLERTSAWLERMSATTGRVVAVTHPAVIRAAIIIALDAKPAAFWRIDVMPLSFVRFGGRDGRWTLRGLGQNPGAA